MIYFVYFILLFGFIRLMVSFINWITKIRLPAKINADINDFVSILIPARNEENNIGNLLSDIKKFTYQNFEIIVYDDNSTDKTCEIVTTFASTDNRIKLIQGNEPEKGWLGKNYACSQLAALAKGNLLLFLDADVRVSDTLIEKAVTYFNQYKLILLSVFPHQLMPVKETRYAVPLMNWILLSLLPLFLVRFSSWKSFSAANGQFMLFDTAIYRKLQPHSKFRNNPVEDIEIIRFYKKEKLKVATLIGNELIQCTMYKNLNEAIAGFSKNIFRFFGGSIAVTILFAILTTLSPFILLFSGFWLHFLIYISFILGIRLFVSLTSLQNVSDNIRFMYIQQLVFLQIIYNALIQKKNKTLTWKDRNINIKD